MAKGLLCFRANGGMPAFLPIRQGEPALRESEIGGNWIRKRDSCNVKYIELVSKRKNKIFCRFDIDSKTLYLLFKIEWFLISISESTIFPNARRGNSENTALLENKCKYMYCDSAINLGWHGRTHGRSLEGRDVKFSRNFFLADLPISRIL